MITFWIIAAIMIMAALAFVVPSLLGKGKLSGLDHDEINLALFKEKLEELEADLKGDNLTEEQFQQARHELEKELLQDIHGEDSGVKNIHEKIARWPAVAVVIIAPVLAIVLYLQLGEKDLLSATQSINPTQATSGEISASVNTQELHGMEEMVERLAQRLASNPEDADGWYLLARSYVSMKRYGEAVLAYSHAHKLKGDDPAVLADYAETLSMLDKNMQIGTRGEELLSRALARDPNHPKSLWLAGVSAAQSENLAKAIEYWQRLSALHSPGSEGKLEVERYIARAQAQLNGTTSPQEQGASQSPAQTASPVALQVNVTLSKEFAQKAAPTDTVFIFARAAQGPRIPLAIVRKQVNDLPVTVQLDDTLSMAPSLKLSKFPEVIVGARISKSGDAMPQSGDLFGNSPSVKVTTNERVQIIIDQIKP